MSYYTEVIVTPNNLINQTILKTDVLIKKSNEVLLTGTIFSAQCEPSEGAVIEIIEVYCSNQRKKKGYVITNQDGEFAIVVEKNDDINYQLNIYEPLILDK